MKDLYMQVYASYASFLYESKVIIFVHHSFCSYWPSMRYNGSQRRKVDVIIGEKLIFRVHTEHSVTRSSGLIVKGKNASVVRIRLLSMRKRRVFPDPIWVTRMLPIPKKKKKYGHRVCLSRNADKNILSKKGISHVRVPQIFLPLIPFPLCSFKMSSKKQTLLRISMFYILRWKPRNKSPKYVQRKNKKNY